jgi:hypothetical protein
MGTAGRFLYLCPGGGMGKNLVAFWEKEGEIKTVVRFNYYGNNINRNLIF